MESKLDWVKRTCRCWKNRTKKMRCFLYPGSDLLLIWDFFWT
jgi:hypothetical protein